jgi:membrane associated rhomboid family serine protease
MDLITHMFLHGSVLHLLFNIYVLFMFGNLLERRIGSKKFITIYFISGLIAGFISVLFYFFLNENTYMLGASGAIMGIIGTLIVIMPNLELLFFFIIPLKLWQAGIFIFLIDLFGQISNSTGIGHIAHMVGLISGILLGLYYKKNIQSLKKKIKGEIIYVQDARDYMKNNKL